MTDKNISLEKFVYMKFLYTCFLAFILPGSMICQIVIDTITSANPGDTIIRYRDLAPEGVEITDGGDDQLWQWTLSDSLVQIASFDTNDRLTDFPFATIKMTENTVQNYYHINQINWGIQGFVAEDPLGLGLSISSFYSPAFAQEYVPVGFQDTVVQLFAVYSGIPLSVIPDSILNTLPVVPDSLRLKVSSVVLDDVDASGILEINNNSVEVLRQRRENRIAIAIEAKVSILPWVDITTLILDLIDSLPGGIDLSDTIVSYRFLAPGYALPVAVLAVNDDNFVGSVLYQADVLSAVKDIVFEASEIQIFPNPTSGEINIVIDNADHIVDRVIVSDIMGRMIQINRVDNYQGRMQLQLGEMSSGLYFLTMIDRGGKLLGTGKVSLIDN